MVQPTELAFEAIAELRKANAIATIYQKALFAILEKCKTKPSQLEILQIIDKATEDALKVS